MINKKTVYRLCREAHLLRHLRPAAGLWPPRPLAIHRTVTVPNRLWEMGLKYGYIVGTDTFFDLARVTDGYDRSLVGYHVQQTATAGHSDGQRASVRQPHRGGGVCDAGAAPRADSARHCSGRDRPFGRNRGRYRGWEAAARWCSMARRLSNPPTVNWSTLLQGK